MQPLSRSRLVAQRVIRLKNTFSSSTSIYTRSITISSSSRSISTQYSHQHHSLFSSSSSTLRPFSTSPIIQAQIPMAAETDTSAAEFASSNQITPESLESKLRQTLPTTTYVSIEDMSGGCGQAFNAIIVSPEFEKKTLLARHRLVNAALKDEIKAIHAWTPKCLTPEQWEKEKERTS